MDQDATCWFCDQPAVAACKRCNRPHCDAHGGDVCALCLDPIAAVPSGRPFRIAILAFPICVLLAGWFLIATPRFPGEAAAGSQPKQAVAPQGSSPTEASIPASPTVTGSRTPSPTATPATRDYTVKANDTIQSIATDAGVSTAAVTSLNPGVDPLSLQVGQVIHLPAKPQ